MFAVEDTTIQICWRGFESGEHTATASAGGVVASSAPCAGRAGAAVIEELAADTEYALAFDGRAAGTVRTLAAPLGPELYRFATVNDVHIGEPAFGFRRTMREHNVAEPYPTRCLRAALGEALDWGAQRVVVKGDLTDAGRAEEFEDVAQELARLDVPVDVVLGNHDVARLAVDGVPTLRAAGLTVITEPTAIDVPGLRIVIAPTARVGDGHGHVTKEQRRSIVELVAGASGAALVAVHHYPQRWRFFTNWPPGIPGPEAQPLLDEIERANANAVFVSGHSHRHRLHRHGSLPVVEIGSTKDYPGTWAGYVVHEGGIRQVVRRVAEPSAFAWTERTRNTLYGVWALWSPGTLKGRCWTIDWRKS